jgi:hypothetical protein
MPREMPVARTEAMRSGSKRDLRERDYEKLAETLKQLAAKINAEFFDEIGAALLEDDATISMDVFALKKGGPFRKTKDARNPDDAGLDTIEHDKALVKQLEIEWTDADDERVQAYFAAENTEKTLEIRRRELKEKLGIRLEMALTIVLHKILGPEFLVLRSATYDDYKNGVDHVIVDRRTGNVVCSFDNVNAQSGSRHEEKLAKVKKKAREGGARVKYGITFEMDKRGSRKIVRRELAHVPTFYLGLSPDELKNLLYKMNFGLDDPSSETELRVFDTLLQALEFQRELLERERISDKMRGTLKSFEESLSRMRDLRARQSL